jgi:hypothetical protein
VCSPVDAVASVTPGKWACPVRPLAAFAAVHPGHEPGLLPTELAAPAPGMVDDAVHAGRGGNGRRGKPAAAPALGYGHRLPEPQDAGIGIETDRDDKPDAVRLAAVEQYEIYPFRAISLDVRKFGIGQVIPAIRRLQDHAGMPLPAGDCQRAQGQRQERIDLSGPDIGYGGDRQRREVIRSRQGPAEMDQARHALVEAGEGGCKAASVKPHYIGDGKVWRVGACHLIPLSRRASGRQ